MIYNIHEGLRGQEYDIEWPHFLSVYFFSVLFFQCLTGLWPESRSNCDFHLQHYLKYRITQSRPDFHSKPLFQRPQTIKKDYHTMPGKKDGEPVTSVNYDESFENRKKYFEDKAKTARDSRRNNNLTSRRTSGLHDGVNIEDTPPRRSKSQDYQVERVPESQIRGEKTPEVIPQTASETSSSARRRSKKQSKKINDDQIPQPLSFEPSQSSDHDHSSRKTRSSSSPPKAPHSTQPSLVPVMKNNSSTSSRPTSNSSASYAAVSQAKPKEILKVWNEPVAKGLDEISSIKPHNSSLEKVKNTFASPPANTLLSKGLKNNDLPLLYSFQQTGS